MTVPSHEKPSWNDAEEGDVWWGSYSLWAVLPGFIVFLVVTGLLAWLTWLWLPPREGRLVFIGIGMALWLTQGYFWSHRVFGHNYRLTTRRLFCHTGFHAAAVVRAELSAISSIAVRQSWQERLLGVGQIIVQLKESAQPHIVLKGVRNPAEIAMEIRVCLQRFGRPN